MAATHTSVDEYISSFSAEVQAMLERVRATIHQAVPGLTEVIRYQMPCVRLDGQYVVYFAAWKHHIGLYPVPTLEAALEREVAPFRAAKDTLRLPFKQPIPYELIARVIPALVQAHAGSGHPGIAQRPL